jgi:hypothetical protein
LNPTYIGAENEEGATTNGVIYPVRDSEFEATQIRESDYRPTRIEPSAITWLDGMEATPDCVFRNSERGASAQCRLLSCSILIALTLASDLRKWSDIL